jgi:hypothetical protein
VQSPIPLVGEAVCVIVEGLEQKETPMSVVKLGERNACTGRSPKAYVEHTILFMEAYHAEAFEREIKTNVLRKYRRDPKC